MKQILRLDAPLLGSFENDFATQFPCAAIHRHFVSTLTRRLGRKTLGEMFGRFSKNREKRLLPCFNLRGAATILDQDNGQDNRTLTAK